MKTLYEKVSRQLERIDFEALWPGFHPFPFALYDGTHAVLDGQLTDCPEDFRGNTAMSFQGRRIAIWNVGPELPRDEERFTSQLVHEMFHAFQMERNEKRFPNDLLLACAELCALEQLSTNQDQPAGANRPACERKSVRRQQEALAECAKRLADPGLLLDPRRCAYDSGSLLLFAARRHGLTLFHDIGNESRPVYEIVLQQLPRTLTADYPVSRGEETLASWSRLLSEQAARREALIQAFLQEAHITIEGCFRICGYDPMNLWRREDTLYSTSFLCLLDQNGNTVTLTGKALLQMLPGSPVTACAYSTMTPGT